MQQGVDVVSSKDEGPSIRITSSGKERFYIGRALDMLLEQGAGAWPLANFRTRDRTPASTSTPQCQQTRTRAQTCTRTSRAPACQRLTVAGRGRIGSRPEHRGVNSNGVRHQQVHHRR